MQQLQIQYFFPLTEQIPLDLDYTESTAYADKKQQEMWSANTITISSGGNGTIGYTFVSASEPSFTIDVDQVPITIVSKNKPNFVKRWIYKTLGMKWKAK
jgi:hypothetical protein